MATNATGTQSRAMLGAVEARLMDPCACVWCDQIGVVLHPRHSPGPPRMVFACALFSHTCEGESAREKSLKC